MKEKEHRLVTRALCGKLDKRKAKLHEQDKPHTTDWMCNLYRDAIKDRTHPQREEALKVIRGREARKHQKPKKKKKSNPAGDFYLSKEWRELRYKVLRARKATCGCCGARSEDGVRIHVDHIKPRSKYPDLALEASNLQVLCEDCNIGKSNYYNDDWRKT